MRFKVKSRPEANVADRRPTAVVLIAGVVLSGTLAVAFWHTITDLWQVWQSRPDYSAGQLVPLAALYLAASRSAALRGLSVELAGTGILVFAAGLSLNLLGIHYLYASLEHAGLFLCANGLVLVLFGWNVYRRLWYPMVFVLLMFPLPNRVHDSVMLPLQEVSARISAGVLEVIGIPTVRWGHVLEVGEHRVAVAEACNGLRMAMAFLIVAAVVAYVVNRPLWQRAVILLSSVPIALLCNILRIVITAWLYNSGHVRLAQGLFHDAAGLLMMPLALGLILVELLVMRRLSGTARLADVTPLRSVPAGP